MIRGFLEDSEELVATEESLSLRWLLRCEAFEEVLVFLDEMWSPRSAVRASSKSHIRAVFALFARIGQCIKVLQELRAKARHGGGRVCTVNEKESAIDI